MLVALHINANIEFKQSHNKILTILLLTYLFHNTLLIPIWIISSESLLYIDLASPFGLMYGPIMYFYYKSLHKVKMSKLAIYTNLIPIIISWITYFVFILNESIRIQTSSYYYPILYGCIGISFVLYSLYIFILDTKNKDYIFSLFSFFLILAGVFMIYLSVKLFYKDLSLIITNDIASNLTMTLFMLLGGLLLFDLVFRLFKSQFQPKRTRHQYSLYNVNNEREKHTEGNEKSLLQTKSISENIKTDRFDKDKELIENFFTPEHIVDKTNDLSKAANILGMSQNRLQNLIYDYYGTTFTKILTIKRIDYACKIILDNDTSEIPDNLHELSGFNSISTFYRNFKNIKGCSPSQYKT